MNSHADNQVKTASAYYAHKKELPDGTFTFQTVQDHLIGVSELAGEFAASFGGEAAARQAGLAHDLGKYSSEFQNRLLRDGPKVDHSTAGALECMALGNPASALCVLGHHAGLPDRGVRGDLSGSSTFMGRMNQKDRIPKYDAFRQEITLQRAPMPAPQTPYAAQFYVRMLYSCLVDADYLDTEAFCTGPRNRETVPLSSLLEKLQNHVQKWYPPQGELNRLRCRILDACMEKGQQEGPGLFTLTVPTGGGKTVASLAFALKHAVAHRKKRIIYVIPYTSIIDQTVDVFSGILGEEQVLAHHSGVDYCTESDDGSSDHQKALAAENWDQEIIVTTAVQFFESLYANRSSKCRKLHNITDSVVIFDEAQVIPVQHLRPCVYAIGELVAHYGVTAVLCTATQPSLSSIFAECLPHTEIREICPAEIAQSQIFQRVQYHYIGKQSWDALEMQLNSQPQALCILNTRQNAGRVFRMLQGEGCYHLSTLMYPAHRKRQLLEIRKRLEDHLPCKVVSTSLIEAGVDVDFPVVFRETAGLTSIVQAAGRCNREGNHPSADSIVTIFDSETAPPPLFSQEIAAAQIAMKDHAVLSDSSAIQAYYQNLFAWKGKDALDQAGILDRISEVAFSFDTIAKDFKLINDHNKTVYIPLEEGAELTALLRQGKYSPSLYRKLNQYAVNIFEKHYDALLHAGDLEVLPDGSAVLSNLDLYSKDTGLSLAADFGKGLFV